MASSSATGRRRADMCVGIRVARVTLIRTVAGLSGARSGARLRRMRTAGLRRSRCGPWTLSRQVADGVPTIVAWM
jgi:hypothetical protein